MARLKGKPTRLFSSKGLVQPHKARTRTLNLPLGWEASKKQLPCFAGILLFQDTFAQTSLAKLKGTSTGFFRSKGLVQPHEARTRTLNLPFGWEASKKQLPCFAGILLFQDTFAQTSLAKLKGTSTGFFRSKGLVQPHEARTRTLNLPFGWEASKKQLPCFAGILLFQNSFCSNKFGKPQRNINRIL